MQIWDLKALFANEKECEQNALNLQTECEKFKDKYLENYENKSNENIIYFSNTGYLEVELVKDYKNYEKWIEAILEKN